MTLYNEERFTIPIDGLEADIAVLEAHDVDPTGVLAYRLDESGRITWWIQYTHPVTGRTYIEERTRV